VQKLVRNGDYWEATVVKNGASQVLYFHALTGMQVEIPRLAPVPK
jgi:hypothetical protein